MPKSNSNQYPNRSQSQMSTPKIDTNAVEKNTKGKSTERDFFKTNLTIKYYKCQVYGHVAANCPSLVKVIIDKKLLVTNSESNSGEIISQAEEPADNDFDKEIKSEKNEESNTLILPENTPVIT